MLISHLSEKTFFFELYEEFYRIMSYNDWVLLAAALLMRHMGQLVTANPDTNSIFSGNIGTNIRVIS